MKRTILALLFTVALTGAAQACGSNNFNASAKLVSAAVCNSILLPVAEQANRSTTLNLAVSSIAAWTHEVIDFVSLRSSIEEGCLATAVYFEARSESQLGQLAVATVILNRVKASNSSICAVVYKGSSHFNACQFSFTCDGKPDIPEDARAWKSALAVTTLALADDKMMTEGKMQMIATATHYHADYVDPYWSKSLLRLTKIGRHIFYSQG